MSGVVVRCESNLSGRSPNEKALAALAVSFVAATAFVVNDSSSVAGTASTPAACTRSGSIMTCVRQYEPSVHGRPSCGDKVMRVTGRFKACGDGGYVYSRYKVTDGVKTLTGRAWITTDVLYDLRHAGGPDGWFATNWIYTATWGKGVSVISVAQKVNSSGRLIGGSQLSSALSWKTQRQTVTYQNVRFPVGKNKIVKFKPGVLHKIAGTSWQRVPKASFKCDRMAYIGVRGGCAFRAFAPTLTMSKHGKAPRTARHIAVAQGKVVHHYGRPGSGHPLTRSRSSAINTANRHVATKMCARAQVKGSCDEYPFASTYQGCSRIRCHVAGVPLADNKQAGSILGTFYRRQRVTDGNIYYVRIIK